MSEEKLIYEGKLNEISLYRKWHGSIDKAVVKKCKKVITIRYYSYNEIKKIWVETYLGENIPYETYAEFSDIIYNYLWHSKEAVAYGYGYRLKENILDWVAEGYVA